MSLVCFSPHNHYTNGHSKTKKENPPRRLIEIFSVKGYIPKVNKTKVILMMLAVWLASKERDAAIFPLFLAVNEIAHHIIHCLEKLFKDLKNNCCLSLITLGQLIWFCWTFKHSFQGDFCLKSRRILKTWHLANIFINVKQNLPFN